MFFFFWNLNFLEYAELYCFPKEMDVSTTAAFDVLSSYSIMSHCDREFDLEDSGVLKAILAGNPYGTRVATYFESQDRMQMAIFTLHSAWNIGGFLGAKSVSVSSIISSRATVFMDILLFRRNLQLELVPAEESCAGCLAHKGYMQNFVALAPYFQGAGGTTGLHDVATVGASAGAVMSLFGAIQLESAGLGVKLVQTAGMPRPGNLAFSKYVRDASFVTIASVYYRDPMPHVNPTLLGYRQATQKYVWLYRTAGGDVSITQVRTDGYRDARNTPMDNYIANKIWFFRVTDHTMYFASAALLSQSRSVDDALSACGQYSDELVVEYHTSDLFNF